MNLQKAVNEEAKFLLTPLREGRPETIFYCCKRPEFISTHAPAGGATYQRNCILRRRKDFYSRPCGRGDERKNNMASKNNLFLLTPLREGRRAAGGQ